MDVNGLSIAQAPDNYNRGTKQPALFKKGGLTMVPKSLTSERCTVKIKITFYMLGVKHIISTVYVLIAASLFDQFCSSA